MKIEEKKVPQRPILESLLVNIYLNVLYSLSEFTNVCSFADDKIFYACVKDLN